MEYGDKDFANVPRLFFITGEGGCGKTFLFNVNIIKSLFMIWHLLIENY
jgi:hypothetical protein